MYPSPMPPCPGLNDNRKDNKFKLFLGVLKDILFKIYLTFENVATLLNSEKSSYEL